MSKQFRKWMALCLLTVFPSSVFAQTMPDTTVRFADRLSRPSILDSFDPSVHSLDIVLDQTAPCDTSKNEGRMAAEDQHGTVGWFVGGIGAGVGLGFIGTGVVMGASALSSPKPATIKAGMEESCYRDGYKSKAKKKNLMSSLIGGLLGTAVWTVIYIANNND